MRVVNDNLRQPIWNKPHIALVNGVWRVSKLPNHSYEVRMRWYKAFECAVNRNKNEIRFYPWNK